MGIAVDRRPADVHSHRALVEGLEFLFFPGKRVVDLHWHKKTGFNLNSSPPSRCPQKKVTFNGGRPWKKVTSALFATPAPLVPALLPTPLPLSPSHSSVWQFPQPSLR